MQYIERDLEVDFKKKYKDIESDLDMEKIKNENYFYLRNCQLYDKRSFYETKLLTGKRKPFYEDLKDEIDQFTLFFVSKMLVYYVMMQNRQSHLNFDFEYNLYEPVMNFISENNFDSYPFIKIYYLTLKLGTNNDNEDIYFELKEYLTTNLDFVEMEDKKLIFTELFNYAMTKFCEEKPDYEKEVLEIMQQQLKHGTYPSENEGWMDYAFYMSYIVFTITAKYPDLTEKFINEFSCKLNPQKKQNLYAFAKGMLQYARKNYVAAIEYLSKIERIDFSLYIRIRALLAKIFFDQQEYESVLTLIDAFKHYLNSNPMIPENLNRKYINFTNVLRKLTLLTISPDKDDSNISFLINEIKNFSIGELTTNKSWLLERAEKLK